jgi:hypothetical protein
VPSQRQTVEAAGRILWSRPGTSDRYALGVSFDALRPIDVWALLQYFNLSTRADAASTPPAVIDTRGERSEF